MSDADENQVLNMRINNKQFLKGAADSSRAIDSLNKSIDSATKGRGMQDLGKGVETVKARFSALQVMGVTALATITNKAVNAGLSLAKSFTVQPITDGFREYEKLLKSTQTIMANTQKSSKVVGGALDELNTYADQTIYNFGQMADAIGKFTAAGVKLDPAVNAIRGMSNTAALFGSDANQLNTAMYQMSQALATGTIKLMDWNSLVNAGMGGKNMQKILKQTARSFGDHGKAMDAAIAKGGSFRDSLQYGWLSADIFTKGMEVMGGATRKAFKDVDQMRKLGYDATAISALQAGKSVAFTAKHLRKMGYSKEASVTLSKLASDAMESATKVKSFAQLIDVAKESIGSGWAAVFRQLLGNLEESGKLWTSVGNIVTGAIDKVMGGLVSMLEVWHNLKDQESGLNGYQMLWAGIGNIFKSIGNLLSPFLKMFGLIAPSTESAGNGLFNLTRFFYNLTVALEKATSATGLLNPVITVLGTVLGILVKVAGLVISYFLDLAGLIQPLAISIAGLVQSFVEMAQHLWEVSKAGERLQWLYDKFIELRAAAIEPVVYILKKLADALSAVFQGDFSGAKKLFNEAIQGFGPLSDALATAGEKLQQFINKMKELGGPVAQQLAGGLQGIKDLFSTIGQALSSVFGGGSSADASPLTSLSSASDKASASGSKFVEVWGNIKTFFVGVGQALSAAAGIVSDSFSWLVDKAKGLDKADIFKGLSVLFSGAMVLTVMKFMRALSDVMTTFKGFADLLQGSAIGVLDETTKTLKTMQTGIKAKAILNIAIAVGILAASLWVLSKIDPKDLAVGLGAIGAMMMIMAKSMSMIGNAVGGDLKGGATLVAITTSMVAMASAMTALSLAVLAFGKMDPKVLMQGMAALAGSIAIMTGAMYVLGMAGPWAAAGAAAMVLASASMLIMAAALTAMAGVVMLYSKIDLNALGSGLLKMGLVLVGLGLSMLPLVAVAPMLLVASAALVVLSAAMLALLGPLAVYAKMKWGTIVSGVAKMGAVLIGLGLAGLIAAPGLIAVGAAFVLVGVGLLAVGTGLALAGIGLTAIAAAGAAAFAVIITGVEAILMMLPTMGTQVVLAIQVILEELAKASPSIVDSLVKISKEILRGLGELLPNLMTFLDQLLGELLDFFDENRPRLIEHGISFAEDFIQGLTEGSDRLTKAGTDLIVTVIEGMGASASQITEAAANTLEDFLTALDLTIQNHTEDIVSSGRSIAGHLIQGLVLGLIPDSVQKAFTNFTNSFVNFFKGLLGINSPSTLFMGFGTDIVQGLVLGIRNMIAHAIAMARSLGTSVVNTAVRFLSTLPSRIRSTLSSVPSTLMGVFTRAFASALGAVTRGTAAIRGGLSRLNAGISNAAKQAYTSAKKLGNNILEGIKSGLSAAGGFVTDIAAKIKGAINSALGLPKEIRIKGGKGKFKVNFGTTIPAFAKGVTGFGGGTALVGEAGPELVTMNKGSNVITNKSLAGFMKAVNALTRQLTKGGAATDSTGRISYNVSADFKGDPRASGIRFAANIADGLITGLKSNQSAVTSSMADMGLATTQSFADTLEINSPSRVFQRYAGYVGAGFIRGLVLSTEGVRRASRNLAGASADALLQTVKDSQLKLEAQAAKADAYSEAAALLRQKAKNKKLSKERKKQLEAQAKRYDKLSKREDKAADAQARKVAAENAAAERKRQFEGSDNQGKADMRAEDAANAAKSASAQRQKAIQLAKEADLVRKYDKKRARELDKQARAALARSRQLAAQADKLAKASAQYAAQAKVEADQAAALEVKNQVDSVSAQDVINAQNTFEQYAKSLADVQAAAQKDTPPITIEQNNYSPEALSPSEIYRNTKNLASLLERKLVPTP